MKQIFTLLTLLLPLAAQATSLTVVEDRGGISALPYYQGLNPEPVTAQRQAPVPQPSLAQGFPVRSPRLTPGTVQGRALNAPGLEPFFLVGDDELSRRWLASRGETLQRLGAAGLAVNVASAQRLAAIRSWAPGWPSAPWSAMTWPLASSLTTTPCSSPPLPLSNRRSQCPVLRLHTQPLMMPLSRMRMASVHLRMNASVTPSPLAQHGQGLRSI
ncbi:integrating conjugative element protein (TIGR03765 family) [Pseudomonas oryzihabitans]